MTTIRTYCIVASVEMYNYHIRFMDESQAWWENITVKLTFNPYKSLLEITEIKKIK